MVGLENKVVIIINTLNHIDKIENILNPTSSQQVKFLGSFIKRSLELRTGGHLFTFVIS